jgi:hypothetical protein
VIGSTRLNPNPRLGAAGIGCSLGCAPSIERNSPFVNFGDLAGFTPLALENRSVAVQGAWLAGRSIFPLPAFPIGSSTPPLYLCNTIFTEKEGARVMGAPTFICNRLKALASGLGRRGLGG